MPTPTPLVLAIVFYLVLFSAAYIYDQALSDLLGTVKWGGLALLLFTATAIGVWDHRRSVRTIGNAPVLVPLVPMAASCIDSVTFAQSIAATMLMGATLLAARKLAIGFQGPNRDRFFSLYLSVGLAVIYTSAVMLGLGISLGRGGYRFDGWTDNPNSLGLLLAPVLVILIARILERRRGWLLWQVPTLLAGVYLLMITGSRAAVLWVLLSILAFGVCRWGSKLGLLLGAIAAMTLIVIWNDLYDIILRFSIRDESPLTEYLLSSGRGIVVILSGRHEVWTLGFELFAERPIFGYGLRSSLDLVSANEEMLWFHGGGDFHSTYVATLVEMGLFGAVVLGAFLLRTLLLTFPGRSPLRARYGRYWPSAALPWALLIGALGHAGFESSFFSPGNGTVLLFWTCLMMALVQAQSAPRGWVTGAGPVDGRPQLRDPAGAMVPTARRPA